MKKVNIIAGFSIALLVMSASSILASVSTATIDSGTYIGWHTAIAIDSDGNKHISYYENDPNYDLKYAFISDGSTTTEAVDTVGNVGLYTSIALDGQGNPHISYIDATNNNLKYAYYNGTSWTLETIGGAVQAATSIEVDASGAAHIAYCGSSYLKYAVQVSTGWWIENITPGNFDGTPNGASLVLDRNGNPHISYTGQWANDWRVHYIYKKDGNWTFKGDNDQIAEADAGEGDGSSPAHYGKPTSLALDKNGNPHIAYIYLESGVRQLRYIKWTGTQWSTQTIAGIPSGFEYEISPSIALDGLGEPLISYYSGKMDVADYNGTSWNIYTIDSDPYGGDYGRYSALKLYSGTANLSYQYIESGFSNSSLKYASWVSTNINPVTSSPQNLGASSVDTTQINWQWSDVNDEIGYNFLAGTYAPFNILVGTDTLGAGTNSWTETGLSPNTAYTRFVQAVDEGNVKNSIPATRYTLPAVSGGVTIEDRTATSILLAWDNGSNPSYTRWQIWRSTDDFSTNTSTLTSFNDNYTSLSFSDSGLSAATTYYYKVRPINEDGLYGSFTTSVSTVTLPPPPLAPSTFTATALSSSSVQFNWYDESNDELGFKLLNPTYGVIQELGANTTYWIDNTLTPNTTSQVKFIRSYHADSDSENIEISTNPFTFTNEPLNPQISVTTTTISLTWGNNSNPPYTRWEILRSSVNFSSTDTLKSFDDNFTDTVYTDNNLTPDTTYQYKIRSINEDGVGSIYSNILEGLTIGNPGKITGLAARQDSGVREILISWISPGDNWYADTFDSGSLFKIQYSTDPAVSWSYNSAQIELDASGINPGVTVSTSITVGLEGYYYIKVWAKDDMDNWSVASDSVVVYASPYTFEDVEMVGSAEDIDMVLSGARPYIAYKDSSGYLKYGEWNDGSGSFDTQIVDSAPSEKISLAIDSAGNAHIVYYQPGNDQLKYAAWNGVSWTTSTLDTSIFSGDTSIFIDSYDIPHIAFANAGIISYYKWTGVDWSTAAAATYDPGGGNYNYCDLAVDAGGYPHISFYTHEDANHALKYTTWD